MEGKQVELEHKVAIYNLKGSEGREKCEWEGGSLASNELGKE